MTIQDITCFLKLAETLSYTKTAASMYISQPAVSRHIASLEQEIGGSLVDRSVRRQIQLTEIGEIFYNGLKQCEDIYQQTLHTVQLHMEESLVLVNLMRGTTFPDSFISSTTTFMAEHPSFKHFANFIECEDFEKVLNRGEILICAKELRPLGKQYESIRMTQTSVPYYIVASKKHRAFADPQNVQLNAIADTTLFLPKMLPQKMRDLLNQTAQKLFGRGPKEVIYLDSVDSVSLFLRSNECFTICTGWHTDVSSSDYRTIPLPLFTDYYALWDPEKCQNPYVRDYLNALKRSD